MINYLYITLILFILSFYSSSSYGFSEKDLETFNKTNVCINCDLSGAVFKKSDLSNAVLTGSNLDKVNFWRANLSNANLECFSNGICSIIPDFNEENLADLDGRKYFPDESLIRIPISDQESELAKAITDLVRNPKKIEKYSKNIFRISKKRLLSWDLRIKNEITLIESLIK